MLIEARRDGAWVCWVADNASFNAPPIPQLLDLIDGFTSTLKDDRRSLVKMGMLDEKRLVAKKPRDKNQRKWSRVLSLLGPAEAKKTFLTLLAFQKQGIESLTPFCVLEKHRCGYVVDSWLLYEYRDGVQSTVDDLPEIVEQLKKLHKAGYRHDDPNLGNFMIKPNGQMFLIDCKGRLRVGRFTDYYDFMLLSERSGGVVAKSQVEALVSMDKASLGYCLARLYSGYKASRTSIKKRLGKKRKKNDKG